MGEPQQSQEQIRGQAVSLLPVDSPLPCLWPWLAWKMPLNRTASWRPPQADQGPLGTGWSQVFVLGLPSWPVTLSGPPHMALAWPLLSELLKALLPVALAGAGR